MEFVEALPLYVRSLLLFSIAVSQSTIVTILEAPKLMLWPCNLGYSNGFEIWLPQSSDASCQGGD